MEQVSYAVHWLTFTVPGQPADVVLRGLGGGHGKPEELGSFGHPISVGHESGARVFFGSKRPDQPVVVNVPGEVCDDWAKEAVTWAKDLRGICTRVDLAADLEPHDLARRRLVEMRRAWLRGQVQTRMSPGSHRWLSDEGPDQGCTAYFGGKTSKLQLRAYDRRGPLRLEFQWRPERNVGQLVPEVLQRRGPRDCWQSLAHSVIFPMPWYRELLKGERLGWPTEKQEESSLAEIIDQLKTQLGASYWALRLLGMQLTDLEVSPERPMRGDLAAKFLKWAREAEGLGYDGTALRQEVKCRLK